MIKLLKTAMLSVILASFATIFAYPVDTQEHQI